MRQCESDILVLVTLYNCGLKNVQARTQTIKTDTLRQALKSASVYMQDEINAHAYTNLSISTQAKNVLMFARSPLPLKMHYP